MNVCLPVILCLYAVFFCRGCVLLKDRFAQTNQEPDPQVREPLAES